MVVPMLALKSATIIQPGFPPPKVVGTHVRCVARVAIEVEAVTY